MQTTELIRAIQSLPLSKRFYVLEEIMKSIRKDELSRQMEMAVSELYADYANDNELTAFTSLDLDDFYEAR